MQFGFFYILKGQFAGEYNIHNVCSLKGEHELLPKWTTTTTTTTDRQIDALVRRVSILSPLSLEHFQWKERKTRQEMLVVWHIE